MTPSREALAPRASTTLDVVRQILGTLAARNHADEVLTCVRQIPAREATFRPLPEWVRPELREAYRSKGIAELYSHQAATAELVHNGKNVVVVTPTASGKTLCYNLPVLNEVLENPDTRALYLFPTKALAQDQLAELHDLGTRLDDRFGVFTYDGDTPSDARKAIRERGHIVLTNPDMLHAGILPHHTKWMRLFENLRYIVIDELHTYRGVFGSHLANVLRRLQRIARFYGSNPQFICCTATIANPDELASQLIEQEIEVVEENGAPSGEKLFVFYNPPMIDRNLGIRRSYVKEATRLTNELLAHKLQTIVFANSRLQTEVILTYLQQRNQAKPGQAEPVRGYRGGYLPRERREIEHGLREGRIRGVVTTSALELGIDIGSLDACVMAGYAGSIASTWQRAGRAGRRSGTSCAIFVASSAPLGSVAFGLAVIEMSKTVEMRHVNGKYIRESEYVPPKATTRYAEHTWTTTKEIPCGLLRLVIYAPYRGVDWVTMFQESERRPLTKDIPTIVRSIEKSTAGIVEKVKEEKRQAERIRQTNTH